MGREGKLVPMQGDSRGARKPPWCPPSGKTWRFLNGRARDYHTVASDIPTGASWVPPISAYKETIPREVKPAQVRGRRHSRDKSKTGQCRPAGLPEER